MKTSTRNLMLALAIGGTLAMADTTFAQMVESEPRRPETPGQQRVNLGYTVAGMTAEQLHPIARSISDRRSAYGLSYRDAGYVGLFPREHEAPAYRQTVLNAIGRCPDEMLVQLAVMIAGAR